MKALKSVLLVFFCLVLVLFSGCAVFDGAVEEIVSGWATESSDAQPEHSGQEAEGSSHPEDEKTAAQEPAMRAMVVQMGAMQFFGVYAMAVAFGGYGFQENYQEGHGTTWQITSGGEDAIPIERALLKQYSDGRQWWQLIYSSGDDELIYEFLTGPDHSLIKLRFRDPDSSDILEYIPDEAETGGETKSSYQELTDQDYSGFIVGKEKIRVKAGTYAADHIVIDNQGQRWEWWASDKVPNGVVKYSGTNKTEGTLIEGELINLRGGYKSKLGSF